jgi:hypothetical protein
MSELSLEPYAAYLHLSLDTVMPKKKWQKIVTHYLETLAQRCDETGECVIGHIKALALFADSQYLRVSVISSSHPASMEGNPPESFKELKMTLNVLVYGLSRDAIQRLVHEAASDLNLMFRGHIALEPLGIHKHH